VNRSRMSDRASRTAGAEQKIGQGTSLVRINRLCCCKMERERGGMKYSTAINIRGDVIFEGR
jgi:hypothetical protein